MKTKTEVNWSYLAGFIESDGAIECFLNKETGQLKYIVKFTSKKNTNTLVAVQSFLQNEGITAGNTDQDNANRAPSIRVQGNNQVVTLLKKLQQHVGCLQNHVDHPKTPLLGVKYRNLCLILAIEGLNRKLTIQEKIDVKKTFHKENYGEADIMSSQTTTSRTEFEKNFNLEKDSSVGAAKQWIAKVDADYAQHVKYVKAFPGKLNADYVVGLYDGDGGFNISFSLKAKDKIVEIQCDVNLTLSKKDKFILEAVKTHFEISSATTQNQEHSSELKIRTQADVKKILSFFEQHPLLGDYKSKSLALVKETLDKKKDSFFKKGKVKPDDFKGFVTKVYEHSNLARNNIETVFGWINEFYQ